MSSDDNTTSVAVAYISPVKEVNAGLWTLFAGATLFLGLRIWCKYSRRTGLWYDDYMLLLSWLVLMTTDILISIEFATGYVTGYWDDGMHILINISSDGTLIGQALSKTALGITLLRISNKKQAAIIWFCIGTMNALMIIKCFFQWAKYCGKDEYQQWYRLQGPCINYEAEEDLKVIGQTYNIIMDFVFAVFPWWITWKLDMRKVEKIALCATMSLGMLVAIISAVRTKWKDRTIMHTHDEYYMWRNGMSNIWYSAEVAGTIIVQCIPILRPFLQEIHTTLTSKRISDTESRTYNTSRFSNQPSLRRLSHPPNLKSPPANSNFNFNFERDRDNKHPDHIALDIIPESESDFDMNPNSISNFNSNSKQEGGKDLEYKYKYEDDRLPSAISFGHSTISEDWRLSGSERDEERGVMSPNSTTWVDFGNGGEDLESGIGDGVGRGLRPPPARR